MITTAIQIPRKITNQLLHLAQLLPDQEICGLIGSTNGLPTTCYPIANRAEQPQTQFALDAAEQIAAMAKMREMGEDLFAIYHSHPTAPAEPSLRDAELIGYPNALYLIISLNIKGILEIRGFYYRNAKFSETPLSLCEI